MGVSQTAAPVLEVDNLTKRFRHGEEAVAAVKNVTLTLAKGEFVAIMGASGAGKSTLLHLVAGLTQPDGGAVRIGGTDIFALRDYDRTVFRRKHVGLVFQAFNLIPTLTGEENMALPLLMDGGAQSSEDIKRLVQQLGLKSVCSRYPDTMSGGEQQRVAIGRALATQPAIVLADEPTGSLDSANSQRLCETLKNLCRERGTTVLVVTHNPVVAFEAQRVVFLRDGEIVREFDTSRYKTVQEFAADYVQLAHSPWGAQA
jgi:putative ABC transport system ATP-binding protein